MWSVMRTTCRGPAREVLKEDGRAADLWWHECVERESTKRRSPSNGSRATSSGDRAGTRPIASWSERKGERCRSATTTGAGCRRVCVEVLASREEVRQWWDVLFPEWVSRVEKERERQVILSELAGLVPSTFCYSVNIVAVWD